MKNLKLILVAIIFMVASACEEVIVIPSVLSFDQSSASGFEGTDYAIGISFDTPVDNQITINYTVSGTASSGVDYSLPSSLTVPSGSTSATLDLQTFDNSDYSATGKTVTVAITDVNGSANVQFGSNTTFTYTILENDLQIFLSWSPSTGIADDHDLDLFLGLLDQSTNNIGAEGGFSDSLTPDEEIIMDQNLSNLEYFAWVKYFSGAIGSSNPNLVVNYTITLNFPDGSTMSNSDIFSLNTTSNRILFSITKNGEGSFSASSNPFGPDGRQAPIIFSAKSK